jgi:hypothetical protein
MDKRRISVKWDSPDKRYVIATYHAGWGWDDFNWLKVTVDEMFMSVDYPVGAIVDVRTSSLVPRNASSGIAKAFSTAPMTLDKTIIVGANSFYQLIIKIVQRLAPNSPAKNITFAKTMDEAVAFMNEHYPDRLPATRKIH